MLDRTNTATTAAKAPVGLTQVAPGKFAEPGVTYEIDVWTRIQELKKARAECAEALSKNGIDGEDVPRLTNAKWAAFDALCNTRARTPQEAAKQLAYLCLASEEETEAPTLPPNDPGGFKLSVFAERLLALTNMPQPTKSVPALSRGSRLTKAGQLVRYHSFLVNELMTVSWELYGSRDYASCMIPMDSYVRQALGPKNASSPFHDTKTLQRRATAVMQSLKIDTTTSDSFMHRRTKARRK